MNLVEEKKKLPASYLRFSKEVVAASLILLGVAGALLLSSWRFGPVVGGVCGGLAFGLFFTAGYYLGCENESCS